MCLLIQVFRDLFPSPSPLSPISLPVFRPKLQDRLAKLEKQLKVPSEDCHIPEPGLADAQDIFVFGTRIRNPIGPLHLDNMIRPKNMISSHFPVVRNGGVDRTQVQVRLRYLQLTFHCLTFVQQVQPVKNTGKSCWKGRDDGEVVSVEEFSLQHYEDEGWRGCVTFLPWVGSAHDIFHRLHSEGRIVYTIFGLLFWDIIFATIPGAFETPFQVAPLDIHTDTFYHSRRELFDKRLAEIKQGKAREIISNVDSKHRNDQTLCVGVKWDLVEKEDLENIAEVGDNARFPPLHLYLTRWSCSTLVAINCVRFLESSLRSIAPGVVVSRICSSGMTRGNVASSSRLKVRGTNSRRAKRFVKRTLHP